MRVEHNENHPLSDAFSDRCVMQEILRDSGGPL